MTRWLEAFQKRLRNSNRILLVDIVIASGFIGWLSIIGAQQKIFQHKQQLSG